MEDSSEDRRPDRTERSSTSLGDRTVLGAAWQYKWLVLGSIAVFAALAYAATSLLPSSYVARASILLEDPEQQAVLSDAQIASDRIVQNQLEVFRSTAVAERAAELAAEGGVDVSLAGLLEGADIVNVPETDLISVSYSGASEQEALIVTTAMLDAYIETRANQRDLETARIIERLESASAAIQTDLQDLQEEISQAQADHDFDSQIDIVLTELTQIETQLSELPANSEQRADLLARVQELDLRLRTLQLAKEIGDGSVELAELSQRRGELLTRVEALELERSDVEIEAQTAGDGIAFVDETEITSVSEGPGTLFTIAIGALLGLLIGLGWAFSLSQRRTKFDDRRQAEAIFDLPLLGDIPPFGRGASSKLPVRETPRSPVSEAFRFASSGIELALARVDGKGVVFLSNEAGEGKTALLANTALAASRQGKQVLVVDADFGNQALTNLLLGGSDGKGLTEVAAGEALLRDVVTQLDVDGFGTVDVLQRGQLSDAAPDFFERESVKQMFRDLTVRYDIVFVDVPPLMQVAYTSTIAGIIMNAVVIIRKGTELRSAQDLMRRARFIGVDILGYLYNAGVSEGTGPLMGSMKNVLGDRSSPGAQIRSGALPND